jgi:transposase-like protein
MTSVMFFGQEGQAKEQIEKLVLGEKKKCPYCRKKLSESKNDYLWCGGCRKKIRIKALTWFKYSKLIYSEILMLIQCWQRKIPPGAVKELTGLSYPTIRRWYSRFRKKLPKAEDQLRGNIEIDESFFGRSKYNNQKIVIGAIARKSKQVRLKIIPNREQDEIEKFIYEHVARESLIHTDCHSSYYSMEWYGYGHKLYNHSRGHFGGTNQIESVWSKIKRSIRRMYGQIRVEWLKELLREWEARFNFPELFTSPFSYLEFSLCSISVD